MQHLTAQLANSSEAATALAPIFTFDHEGAQHAIRTTNDSKGALWFVAKDICDALGITNSSRALTRLDPDEKGKTKLYTLGGDQDFATVNQSGLYALAFQSRMASARVFRKWITSTVIPAIYSDGLYVRGEELLLSAATPAQLQARIRDIEATAARGIEAKAGRGLCGLEERTARSDAFLLRRGRTPQRGTAPMIGGFGDQEH